MRSKRRSAMTSPGSWRQSTAMVWQGPLTTSYGLHLVRITHRGEPTRATLADARDVVAREWSRAQTAKLKEQFYQMLARRYTVRVEADANVPRTARK